MCFWWNKGYLIVKRVDTGFCSSMKIYEIGDTSLVNFFDEQKFLDYVSWNTINYLVWIKQPNIKKLQSLCLNLCYDGGSGDIIR